MALAVAPVASTASADGVEHRQAEMGRAAFAGRDAADHLGPVGDRLLGVEGALRAGEALADHARLRADENGHEALCVDFPRRRTRASASVGHPIGDAAPRSKPHHAPMLQLRAPAGPGVAATQFHVAACASATHGESRARHVVFQSAANLPKETAGGPKARRGNSPGFLYCGGAFWKSVSLARSRPRSCVSSIRIPIASAPPASTAFRASSSLAAAAPCAAPLSQTVPASVLDAGAP